MDSGIVRKASVVAILIVVGLGAGHFAAADPAADALPPAAQVDTPPAAPARPQTADEKALQAYADTLQAQLAVAASAGNVADYGTALNKIAAKNCQFFSVSGQSVTLPKFLDIKRQAFAGQGTGLAETSKTQTLIITGPTALQTGVLTDDQDVADAAGTYGKKGKTHHWQRLTFFRAHWADTPTRRTSAKRAGALNPDDWKAQEIAFTDIQIFLDGSPYSPPSARKTNTRRNTTPARIPRTNTLRTTRPRTPARRYPYVITGGSTTTF